MTRKFAVLFALIFSFSLGQFAFAQNTNSSTTKPVRRAEGREERTEERRETRGEERREGRRHRRHRRHGRRVSTSNGNR